MVINAEKLGAELPAPVNKALTPVPDQPVPVLNALQEAPVLPASVQQIDSSNIEANDISIFNNSISTVIADNSEPVISNNSIQNNKRTHSTRDPSLNCTVEWTTLLNNPAVQQFTED